MSQSCVCVRHAANHNYITMNYVQGRRQVQLHGLWIEQFWSVVILSYWCWCRNGCLFFVEEKPWLIVSLTVPAGFLIFPQKKDETRLCPGGNVFSLHGSGAGVSILIKSIFLPQWSTEKREDSEREWAVQLGVIVLINLMALVAHLRRIFSLLLALKSTGEELESY